MRLFGKLLGQGWRIGALELTAADIRPTDGDGPSFLPGRTRARRGDLRALQREIEQVAGYVSRLKREIATLRPGELSRDQLPATVDEIRQVRVATEAAVDRIMAAAEELLARPPSGRADRDAAILREKLTEIIEACSFQDIVGQRLTRAETLLDQLQRRITRFGTVVNISDTETVFDRETIRRQARKEVLLVDGPQASGEAIGQAAIDKLFD